MKISKQFLFHFAFLALVFLACNDGGTMAPPVSPPQPVPDPAKDVRVDVPDIFQGPTSTPSTTCLPVVESTIRFEKTVYNNEFSNWRMIWAHPSTGQNTYAVKLYNPNVSQTQPVWQWMVGSNQLELGLLSNNIGYTVDIMVVCPNNTTSIVVDDLVMK